MCRTKRGDGERIDPVIGRDRMISRCGAMDDRSRPDVTHKSENSFPIQQIHQAEFDTRQTLLPMPSDRNNRLSAFLAESLHHSQAEKSAAPGNNNPLALNPATHVRAIPNY